MATTTPMTAVVDKTGKGSRPQLILQELHEWVTTVDHKRLGIMYILYAMVFLVVAGFEALLIRVQLAVPNNTFLSPQTYNRMFTMHGTTMVFFVGMPILCSASRNYLVPLMIGARDMAFPRLNAPSASGYRRFGGMLLYFSYLGGDGLYGAGIGPRCRLVCVRSADGDGSFRQVTARTIGHSGHPAERHRNHGYSIEYCDHDNQHALQGNEALAHAPVLCG